MNNKEKKEERVEKIAMESGLNVNDVVACIARYNELTARLHASEIVQWLQFIILYIMHDETSELGSEGLIGGSRDRQTERN